MLTLPKLRSQRLRPTADRSQSVPYTLSGLLADFNADTLRATLADAVAVTTWNDDSGNGNAIGNTGTNRPTFDAVNPQFNGHASVNFAKASTQYLFGADLPICAALSAAAFPATVFVVARRSTKVAGAEEAAWSLGDSSTATQNYATGTWYHFTGDRQRQSFRIRDDSAVAESRAQGALEYTDLGPQVLVWSLSGTVAGGYAVGGSQNPRYDARADNFTTLPDYSAQSDVFAFDRFALGALLRDSATLPATMEVARVLIYDRELGNSDRERICQHLWNTYVARRIAAPTDLPGCQHWYDANTLAEAEDAEVLSWPDAGSGEKDLAGSEGTGPTVSIAPNGRKVLTFTTDQVLAASTAADWTFLHDGSDWSMFVVYRVVNADRDGIEPLVDTCLGDPINNTGIGVYHDNTGGGNHKLNYVVGASDATDEVLNHATQAYGSRPQAWHVAEWTYEGTIPSTEENYQLWLDNEHYANVDQDAGVTLDTGSPDAPLTVGSDGTLFAEVQIAEIIIYNRKLGKPTESQLVHEYLARKWNTSHAALVAGNAFPNTLNDATPHRGFPAICQDSRGAWHCVYRRAADHGSSRGVGVHITSADGIRWSPERVIYDIDDDDGQDWRGGCAMICLQQGEHAGRLLLSTNWATDVSGLEVEGFASTNLIGYSDDHGGTWTWINPQENDPKNVYEDPWIYTVANAGALIELSTGRILLTFTSADVGNGTADQDLNLCYSDDGGLTWSDSVIIGLHDVCFNNQANKRVTESWIVEWDDGDLSMFIRNDTDKEIWRATANISDVEDWTFDSAKLFDGYGRPTAIRDPNAAAGLYMFHRSDPGDLTVWRYSSDEGVNWTAARAFTNLHATTGTLAGDYPTMAYAFPAVDSDGNIWVASALEDTGTADIFVRRWADVEA